MSVPVIDWTVAEWIAGRVAAAGSGAETPGPPAAVTPGARATEAEAIATRAGATRGAGIDLAALAEDALGRVVAYAGLEPSGPIPRPEGVSRPEWVRANIKSMRTMFDPLLHHAATRIGRENGTARLWLGLVSSTEIGLMVGYMARHVLGQYELTLLAERDTGERPRLLLVLPNLNHAVGQFGANRLEFFTWVTLHEVTHAVQFGSVPWLRDYIGSLIRELMGSAERRLDHRPRLRLPRRGELARIGRAALHADLLGMLAGEQERATIDRAQAVMAVIEGHAEHVMDAVAPDLLPTLPQLRATMDARRQSQRGISKLLAKLLGLEMKLRQYAQGKAFCDALVAAAGPAVLQYLFSSADALPTLAELEQPSRWLERHREQLPPQG